MINHLEIHFTHLIYSTRTHMDYKAVIKPFGVDDYDMPIGINPKTESELHLKYGGMNDVRIETHTKMRRGSLVSVERAIKTVKQVTLVSKRSIPKRSIKKFGEDSGNVTIRSKDEVFMMTPQEYQEQLTNTNKMPTEIKQGGAYVLPHQRKNQSNPGKAQDDSDVALQSGKKAYKPPSQRADAKQNTDQNSVGGKKDMIQKDKVHITNMSPEMTRHDLMAILEKVKLRQSVNGFVKFGIHHHEDIAYAYVSFYTETDAARAIEILHNYRTEFHTRLHVEYAKDQKNKTYDNRGKSGSKQHNKNRFSRGAKKA